MCFTVTLLYSSHEMQNKSGCDATDANEGKGDFRAKKWKKNP
jgi:hypothetical protein